MTLFGIRSIEDLSDWEDATASYYQSAYNNNNNGNNNGGAMMEDAVVKIRLTNQNTINVNGRRIEEQRQPKQRHSRMLQQQTTTATSVLVTYSQSTTYRSIDPNLDVATMLRLPLSTDEYRMQYMQGLKLNLDGYEDLESVSSITTPFDDDDDADGNRAVDGTNDAGGLSTVHVIGIACGAAAFLLLVIGGFVYYRRMDEKDEGARADANGGATTAASAPGDYVVEIDSPSASPERYSKKRTTDTAAEESPSPAIGDRSVASYDDCRRPELFDGSAEELLTVYAPAGKLGIVIDSPDDGAPVIHNVKGTSPIADKVREGDRLVGVDEEDVRAMTAIKVSRLISRKSSNSRRLIVIRYVASN
mmetsp:Transcript_4901/g.8824  ORF Transcript_4901/g.8824 Transcript_4901/m.8824 type:complete len:361 (+) Transcript_4901:876-1958(+)